ncbi:hypothetical protein [Mixta calida]|uniref:hypothetical protein n=1 Tax=Mixta calida TaxID=665913 RepID=UPI0034D76F81
MTDITELAQRMRVAAESNYSKNLTVTNNEIITLCDALSQRDEQIAGLTAENVALKHPGTYLPSKRETPATDAVVNEFMAQGVEQLKMHPAIELFSMSLICDEFAQQLREGK